MKLLTETEMAQLERLCDDFSLYQVLNALAHICHEKAEHIDQSYQDELTSDMWRKRGLQVQATAEYLERMESFKNPFASRRNPTHPPQGRLKR